MILLSGGCGVACSFRRGAHICCGKRRNRDGILRGWGWRRGWRKGVGGEGGAWSAHRAGRLWQAELRRWTLARQLLLSRSELVGVKEYDPRPHKTGTQAMSTPRG